jgi:hypothetical protein
METGNQPGVYGKKNGGESFFSISTYFGNGCLPFKFIRYKFSL